MTHADVFQYVDMGKFLTEAEWSAEGQPQLAAAVTPKWRDYFTEDGGLPALDNPVDVTLSRHGVLQICLSRIELFQDCEANQIRDLRATPIEAPCCRHCPLLIETLANALLRYEDRQRAMAADAQDMPQDMMQA
jgi:hypothetical protein